MPAVYPSAVCRPTRRADPSGVPAPPAVPRPLTPPFPRPLSCKQFTFQSFPPFHIHKSTFHLLPQPQPHLSLPPTLAFFYPLAISQFTTRFFSLLVFLFFCLLLVSFLQLSFSPCSSFLARPARHTNWRRLPFGVSVFVFLSDLHAPERHGLFGWRCTDHTLGC